MKQEAALFAWQGIENYDGVRPLENFLWVHVRNRLYNLKRNNYARPDTPCDHCPFDAYIERKCTLHDNLMNCEPYARHETRNELKKNLMSTKQGEDMLQGQPHSVEDTALSNELYSMIDKAIPIFMREDWLRFVNKLRLPKAKRETLLNHIRLILSENGIDP
jgi:hypothetical protein